MDIQAPHPLDQNTLPYQPIKFVYTQTIGSVLQKFKQIVDPYTWTYEDILQPKILTNASKVQYYLFHVAPIYNWLRKVDSQILANYINQNTKGNNNLAANKLSIYSQKSSQQFKKFETKSFLTELKHYISQWQIVKLSACAKVKIITTKVDHHTNNQNNKQNFKTSTAPNKQQQMRCTHLIKKQKFISEYALNNFVPSNIRLQCTKVYCQDCQAQVDTKTQILKYPFAPYFQKYYGKDFVLNDNTTTKINYQLILVYTPDKAYVKTSGGVWYQITKQKTSIVSFDKIQTKNGNLFVYQQAATSNKILRKAQPLKISQKNAEKLQRLSNMNQEEQSQDQFAQIKKKIEKQKLKTLEQFAPAVQTQSLQNQDQNKDEDGPLQDMTKAPLPIVMKKKNTDKKLFKEYKKTVEGLIPKPKQKDEYEKQYDKGKTKKIHKNRQQFRTADFFKLYKEIKGKPAHSGQSNKDYENDQGQQDNHRRDSNNDNKPYRQKDQEYNEVYTDRRNQRRQQRGRFGNNHGQRNDRNGHHRNDKTGGNRNFKKDYNNGHRNGSNGFRNNNRGSRGGSRGGNRGGSKFGHGNRSNNGHFRNNSRN